MSEAIKLLLPDDVALLEDISDPLSRKEHHLTFLNAISIAETSPSYDDHESSLQQFTVAAINSLQSVTWTHVRLATASNDDMNQLLSIIESGMPNSRHQLPPNLQEYFQFRAHLSTIDGVITYKDRIVILPCLQDTILSALHSAHSGVSSMLAHAESSVFWPGITPAIQATRQNCSHCNRMAPSQPNAPPTPPVPSAYPFQCVCCDFFSHKGSTYHIYIDRYSNWPVIERSQDGAKGLVNSLRRAFVTYGTPEELASDGGPEFQSNTLQGFLRTWGVHHQLSSITFPHSNCRAELGVKIMKRILTNNIGPNGGLDVDAVQ